MAREPREIPNLLVRHGEVFRPGPEGPEAVVSANGRPVDAFDAFDRLTPNFRRIYIADLDGIERGEPQLDLWQELAREADLWIDAGVRTADQAIDVLVSGARRAILTTGRLRDPKEVERMWALSQEVAIEIGLREGKVLSSTPEWKSGDPVDIAGKIRAAGPTILILSPRGEDVDWELVRRISAGGTTYVDGSYPRGAVAQLTAAGARGGVFYPDPSLLVGSAPE